jgi:hypothetical protein
VFYKSNYAIASEVIRKVSNHRFLDYGFKLLIGLRMEALMLNIGQEG